MIKLIIVAVLAFSIYLPLVHSVQGTNNNGTIPALTPGHSTVSAEIAGPNMGSRVDLTTGITARVQVRVIALCENSTVFVELALKRGVTEFVTIGANTIVFGVDSNGTLYAEKHDSPSDWTIIVEALWI